MFKTLEMQGQEYNDQYNGRNLSKAITNHMK